MHIWPACKEPHTYCPTLPVMSAPGRTLKGQLGYLTIRFHGIKKTGRHGAKSKSHIQNQVSPPSPPQCFGATASAHDMHCPRRLDVLLLLRRTRLALVQVYASSSTIFILQGGANCIASAHGICEHGNAGAWKGHLYSIHTHRCLHSIGACAPRSPDGR